MKLWFRIVLGLLAIALFLFAAGWIYFVVISETRVSWHSPLSRDEALATEFGSTLGLPPSAGEVYAFYRNEGSQQNLVYVRFTATPEDIERFIQQEFNKHQSIFPKETLLRSSISNESFQNLPWAVSRPRWWRPQTISTGTYIRIDSGFGPRFWIDTVSKTLYYYDFS